MTSPDFRQYVDLTINDLQPQDIYDNAVVYALQGLPGFDPRPGTVEDAMLQAMSFVSGLLLGAINRLPNGLMEGLLRLMGFERDEATFATGSVIFTSLDNDGLVIPAGTQVAFTEFGATGVIQHIFSTDVEVVIPFGDSVSDPVPVTADSSGKKPIISDGDSLFILTSSNKLFSCVFSGTLSQGVVGESDDSYFARGVTYLASLSSALATANQISNYILTYYKEVFRATAVDLRKLETGSGVRIFESSGLIGASLNQDIYSNFDEVPAPGDVIRIYGVTPNYFNGIFEVDSISDNPDSVLYFTNTVGASSGESHTGPFVVELLKSVSTAASPAAGWAIAFVSGINGASVTPVTKKAIFDDVINKSVAGLRFGVFNALIVDVSVSATVSVQSGFIESTVLNAAKNALEEFLSPNSWDWSSVIRKNVLITRLAQVEGIFYVDDVTVTISSSAPVGYIDSNGDVVFDYFGVLPSASVTVSAV
jgi:hypothetical protein